MKKAVLFTIFQTLLFSVAFVFNMILNHYISPPFETTDLIATGVAASIMIPFIHHIDRIYLPFQSLGRGKKIGLSVIAFAIAVVLGGVIGSLWMFVKG